MSEPGAECPVCGERLEGRKCSGCGWTATKKVRGRPAAPASPVVRACPSDGGELDADGYCQRGRGWPLGADCRFACPLCRAPLEWDGKCLRCYGQATAESQWTIPGDRYELEHEHWRLVARGPQEPASEAETAAAVATLRALLGGTFSLEVAEMELSLIFPALPAAPAR